MRRLLVLLVVLLGVLVLMVDLEIEQYNILQIYTIYCINQNTITIMWFRIVYEIASLYDFVVRVPTYCNLGNVGKLPLFTICFYIYLYFCRNLKFSVSFKIMSTML